MPCTYFNFPCPLTHSVMLISLFGTATSWLSTGLCAKTESRTTLTDSALSTSKTRTRLTHSNTINLTHHTMIRKEARLLLENMNKIGIDVPKAERTDTALSMIENSIDRGLALVTHHTHLHSVHTHVHVHTHARANTHTHTHTHAHTHTLMPNSHK